MGTTETPAKTTNKQGTSQTKGRKKPQKKTAKDTRLDAIRNYITLLNDPGKLVDQDKIDALEQQLADETDPLARVQTRSELERAKRPNEDEYRKDFVANVKSWADENGVGPEALKAEGVPVDVLREAGFKVGQPKRGSKQSGKKQQQSRSRRVSPDEIEKVLSEQTEPFSIAEISKLSGASNSTVRKVVRNKVDTGELVEAGRRDSDGPGRPAPVFTFAEQGELAEA